MRNGMEGAAPRRLASRSEALQLTCLLCAAVAVLLAAGARAESPCTDTPSCLAAIEKAQRDTRSMTATFVQVKHVQLLDEPIVSRGRLSFRKPDRVRLDIDAPVRSTVLIKGREIFVPGLSDADRQAMAGAPAAAMFTQLGQVFAGDTAKLQEGFEVTAAPAGTGIDVILIPRLEAWRTVFRRMEIRFDGGDLAAREVRLDDVFGDRLEVKMEDVQRNADLPDSLFEAPESPRD